MIVFLYLHLFICCGFSLETSLCDISKEYPQHMISWRNKKHAGRKKISRQRFKTFLLFFRENDKNSFKLSFLFIYYFILFYFIYLFICLFIFKIGFDISR